MRSGALLVGPNTDRPRAPGMVYAVFSAGIVLVVGALALTASQAPPPQVAEFAPQAIEQIKKAPSEQGSAAALNGAGGGNGSQKDSSGGGTLGPTPTPSFSPLPRTRRCYTQTDGRKTQTEDPQSPDCVPPFGKDADNGGATSFGVTRDQITVAWPNTIEKPQDTQDLVTYFNTRYEMYGRKIVLKSFNPSGSVFGPVDANAMQSDADQVYQQFQPFASLAYRPKAGIDHYYYDRLAREPHGIVSVNSHAISDPESHFTDFAPFEWSYLPAYDTMMRSYGEFICRQVAGNPPSHSGAGIDKSAPRVFGLVRMQVDADRSSPDGSFIKATLHDQCGVTPITDDILTSGDAGNKREVISDLKLKGATTIICLCQGGHYFGDLMPQATNQAYFPEWLVSSFHYLDYDSVGQRFPAEHADHVFGITFHNKWLPQKDMPWYQAIKEVDPDYETGDDGYASTSYERYYELLTLVSGIQMAGPNLTPQSFQQGLMKARFPTPGSGIAPLYYSGGGFGVNDHSMIDDAATVWWSPSAEGYTTNVRRGTYCYIDHGKRYGIGQWPAGEPAFFQGQCK